MFSDPTMDDRNLNFPKLLVKGMPKIWLTPEAKLWEILGDKNLDLLRLTRWPEWLQNDQDTYK